LYNPVILGVLNVSPESGPSDSLAITEQEIIYRAKFLVENGACYIDVGARSTSNRNNKISDKEEIERLVPAIAILKKYGYKISIDTWSIETARKCVKLGVDMINFTGGYYSTDFFKDIKNNNIWLIMTYMPYGNPYVMDSFEILPFSVNTILNYFVDKIKETKDHGIKKVIIDPNTGIFHKNLDKMKKTKVREEIINSSNLFKTLGYPIMMFVPMEKEMDLKRRISSLIIENKYEYIRTHDPHLITELLHISQE